MAKAQELTAQSLRGKSAEELKGLIGDWKKEQFNLRFQAAAGEAASGNRTRQLRRAVARALTLLNQKKEQ